MSTIKLVAKLINDSNGGDQENSIIRISKPSYSTLLEQLTNKFKTLSNACFSIVFFDTCLKTELNLLDDESIEDLMDFLNNPSVRPEDKFITVRIKSKMNSGFKPEAISDFPSDSFSEISDFPSDSFSEMSILKKEDDGQGPTSYIQGSFQSEISSSMDMFEKQLERRYSEMKVLDSGGFGTVYKVIDKKSGKERALKIMTIGDVTELNDALQEALKTTKLLHPCIVETSDVFLPGVMSKICIEMELMKNGNLLSTFIKPKVQLSDWWIKKGSW